MIINFFRQRNIGGWVVFITILYLIVLIKLVTFQNLEDDIFFGAYSILVSFYILSRFLLAHLYCPEDKPYNSAYEPTISFAVPSKNEGENIRETILRIAATDYPRHKFDIIAVNDGSTDNTLSEMLEAQRRAWKQNVRVKVVDWPDNRGKREGMAECVRQSRHDIVIFIDSDSFVVPDTARELVKYFFDPKVSAVAGHAYVANSNQNFITKMQAVRYFIAFQAYKAAESLFGSVTCCSGCCSAYRREHMVGVLERWLNQKFLGVRCTYGDDRSLTNYLLQKGYKALFAPAAISYTFVPDTFRKFMKQQLRWKKSWVRESFKAGLFIWRRNPIMSLSFYVGVILPLIAPVVVVRALVIYPLRTGEMPWFYLFGLGLMALVYGLYYYLHMKDWRWVYGVFFATFYTIVLIWQLPYAILNIRDASWGTR